MTNTYQSAVMALPLKLRRVFLACLAEHTAGLFIGATDARQEADDFTSAIWRLALDPATPADEFRMRAFALRVPQIGDHPSPRSDLGMKAGAATLDLFDALQARDDDDAANAALGVFGALEVVADAESSDFSGLESYDMPTTYVGLTGTIRDEWEQIRTLLSEVHTADLGDLQQKHHQYGRSLAATVAGLTSLVKAELSLRPDGSSR